MHAARIIERNANRGMRAAATYDTMIDPTASDPEDKD